VIYNTEDSARGASEMAERRLLSQRTINQDNRVIKHSTNKRGPASTSVFEEERETAVMVLPRYSG